jgi:recombinase
LGKAPPGYRNVRSRDENGREVRTVTLDEEHAPLIRLVFQEYVTGNWTVRTLADHLNNRDLTIPPTAHKLATPVSVERLQKLLRHPYYKGVVTFQGVEYAGQHEPLVDAATWQTVQDILAAHTNGERQRMHNHHLNRTIVCSFCGARRRLLRLLPRVGDRAVLWDFCVRALEEARVALTPGRDFGVAGRHARVPVLHGQPGGDRPRS